MQHSRTTDFSERYNELVKTADLADHSAVRGCMIIKPYGYEIWENMQHVLDTKFKELGHRNAYFPLLIPKSFLSKEAAHVEGFAKECAVVTHYRLKNDPNGKGVIVDPEAKLEEELIIRPTSETIIWHSYKDRIKSYRDLPVLVNQRANIVRREMRTRLFLRTTEFLWQEGHTAHATKDEAVAETKQMLEVYDRFAREYLAISAVKGRKSESEKFAGAEETYCIEAMMQDGKALQAGTSHFLGQNFAKAFDVTFMNKENKQEHVRATSRGVSTRLMGALIMSHSDDKGLVLPPAIAPIHIVIVPIFKTAEEKKNIWEYLEPALMKIYHNHFQTGAFITYRIENGEFWSEHKATDIEKINIKFKFDDDDQKSPGRKYNQYELQGVPLRVAVGARDMANGVVEVFRRDTGTKESVKIDELAEYCTTTLSAMQKRLLQENVAMRVEKTKSVDSYDEFKKALERGEFILAHWDGTPETEEKIKEETKATIRCIPLDSPDEEGKCILTGGVSKRRVLFARAY